MAAEQNGIDILCDAAGSDMLLSSLFALAAPAQDQHQRVQVPQHQGQHELQHPLPSASPSKQSAQHPMYQQQQQLDPALPLPGQQESSRRTSSSLPAKRKLSDASISSPSHVCHICRRVYERADHLTRHLRSHENARPYQCSRCPKRFNRADLLTRHETTHDRDGAAKDRPFIRRSDRAAEACLNCAASKAKCEDQKPCSRCRSKSLTCQMPARRGTHYRTSESQAGMSPSESSMVASNTGNDSQVFTAGDAAYALTQSTVIHAGQSIDSAVGYAGSSFLGAPSVEGTPEESLYFTPVRKLFPDIEYSWDVDFAGFIVPSPDVNGRSPQQGNATKRSSRQARKDAVQEDAILRRSPWVFENDTETSILRFNKVPTSTRDRLFALVLTNNPTPHRVPQFPPIELLRYLHDTHFVYEDQRRDAFIHQASFEPAVSSPELLSAVISSGATHISSPAIWQFGLALDEVTKTVITYRLGSSDSAARDLMLLQASMLHLDIGQWSGFSRKTEATETFAPQLLTLLRRSGRTCFSSDTMLQMPKPGESSEILESKWQQFAMLESHKRLIIRMFLHDTQSSIGLWKNPLMSHNELGFSLPAAQDLWKANTPEEWLELHRAKRSPHPSGAPRVSDVSDCISFISDPNDWIDIELCCTIALHGLWGQVWTYREAVRRHDSAGSKQHGAEPPTWTKALFQELYNNLLEFSSQIQEMQIFGPELMLLAELFMMMLHISLDDVQQLAGKNGDEEARKAAQLLEDVWFSSPESRYAVWHAGQVLRHARDCKPASLQGFNAMAVYFASLVLWAYGTVSSSGLTNGHQAAGDDYVPLNGKATMESRAFLELGNGTPALAFPGGLRLQMEPLLNPGAALSVARNIFRQNFPVTNEPVPPYIGGLCRHLIDLELGPNGQMASSAMDTNNPAAGVRSF
ncbi:hypothetical protein ACJ41O_009570 [Fusarium nematophilum]